MAVTPSAAWIAAVRPRTLLVGVTPVLVGLAQAWREAGRLDTGIALLTLLVALAIQVATNLHNDAADFDRGADDPHTRQGPARAVAQGWLPAATVRRAAYAVFGIAVLLGLGLVARGGWPILLLGLAAVGSGLAYTGGPRPLGYLGLGEVFVWAFFGVAAVGGTVYLQTLRLDPQALWLGAVLGFPAAAVLVVNNARDRLADARAGKRTLAVRWGLPAMRSLYAALMLAPVLGLVPLVVQSPWTALGWVTLPWALALVHEMHSHPPGPAYNGLLVATARWEAGFGLLVATGLVLSRALGAP
ncbi:MAG TPA: 1,4-dihydroxy-2-naphthoate octaprenyltransferase [Chromatiales bacterium]|nr:1,4-dihydroxy-2-naphthoate octaprenyltransferase [Chromatiales bacterium]